MSAKVIAFPMPTEKTGTRDDIAEMFMRLAGESLKCLIGSAYVVIVRPDGRIDEDGIKWL